MDSKKQKKIQITLDVEEEPYYKLRGLLFNKGLTFSDLINYLNIQFLKGGEKNKEILEEALEYKLNNIDSNTKIVKEIKNNKNLVYKLLKELSALNGKEKDKE
jgi:hypothetical protein